MATLTLRVDDETRDELERVAQGRGVTVSTLMRAAIDELLGRGADVPRADAPRTMSMIERQHLVLQHEILRLLSTDKDDVDWHEQRIQVLREGFTSEYHKEFLAVSAELSPAECALTMDILDMFVVLEAAVGRLHDDQLVDELGHDAVLLEFKGFDHNDPRETRLADFAKHLIDSGRWEALAVHFDDEHEHGNSHTPVLGRYQRLLSAFSSVITERKTQRLGSLDTYRLGVDDLKKVLAAARPVSRSTRKHDQATAEDQA